jgi:short-subunit dehydrogenase
MAATNKTALVTGASSGIGLELAKCFAKDGHNVVLVGRSETELDELAKNFENDYGIRATVIAKDLFEPKAARELYDEVRSRGIEVNYLVNDAGQGVYGKFAETDLDKELAIIELNVCSTVVLTKLFLKDMLARNEGRILQLASIVSKTPAPRSAIYSGTKAFIYNFTQAVISELDGTAVTMTALRPGATDTDFFRKESAENMRAVQEGDLAPANEVARDGYKAMMQGQPSIVSGLKNKAMDQLGDLMPDTLRAKQSAKLHEPVDATKKDEPVDSTNKRPALMRIVLAATAAGAGVTALGVLASVATRLWAKRFAESVTTVNRPLNEVYAFWRDENNVKQFFKSVPTGLEIVASSPDQFIELRSADGLLVKSASVTFNQASGREGTEVRVTLDGRIPRRLLHEDLRRSKRLLETGELPTTEGQSAGPGTAVVGRMIHRLEGKEVA